MVKKVIKDGGLSSLR